MGCGACVTFALVTIRPALRAVHSAHAAALRSHRPVYAHTSAAARGQWGRLATRFASRLVRLIVPTQRASQISMIALALVPRVAKFVPAVQSEHAHYWYFAVTGR